MAVDIKSPQEVYLDNRSALVDYAARLMGSRDHAEDIVQDAFFRLTAEQAEQFSSRQVLAYLYRIVRNLAYDALRRRKLEARAGEQDPPFWILPQDETSPEQAVLLNDQARLAADTLRSLPPEMRRAVELYRIEGWTLEAVAAELNLSTATAHRLVRAGMVRIAMSLDRALD